MTDLIELEKMILDASSKVREAVNISVEIKTQGLDYNKQVAKLWEGFLKNFICYVKQKNRESGHNLMVGISFSKIIR